MNQPTTDTEGLRRQRLEESVYEIADYLHCNGAELWIEISKLFTQFAEQVAREAQLVGVAKILDNLWDNSYYSMGKSASERLEQEMIYYFGDNWTSTMYEVMRWDGVSQAGKHPVPTPTLAQLSLPTIKGEE